MTYFEICKMNHLLHSTFLHCCISWHFSLYFSVQYSIVAQEKTSVGKVRKLRNFGSSVLGPQFKLCLALKSYRIAKPSTLSLNNVLLFVLLSLVFSDFIQVHWSFARRKGCRQLFRQTGPWTHCSSSIEGRGYLLKVRSRRFKLTHLLSRIEPSSQLRSS